MLPGMDLFHIQGGPAVADAVNGFVRLAAGLHFPPHTHVGNEKVFVLEGAARVIIGQFFKALARKASAGKPVSGFAARLLALLRLRR